MRHKVYIGCLAGTAAGCVLLVLLTRHLPAVFSSLLAFPLEQVAAGLTALSATGSLGNGLSLALWAALSLLPLLGVLSLREEQARAERVALCVLALAICLGICAMANPSLCAPQLIGNDADGLRMVRAVIGGTVWSVAIAWVVLRLLRLFRGGDQARLLEFLKLLLHLLGLLIAASSALSLATEALTLPATASPADALVAVLRLATEALPALLELVVLLRALALLQVLGTEEQDGLSTAAERLDRSCRLALALITAVTALFNLLRALLMRQLSQVHASVELPLTGLVLVAVVLLLTRLLRQNRQLRDDNSLFI